MSKFTKLIKHPVKFFDDARKKKIELNKLKRVKKPLFAFRVNEWKRPLIESWMPDRTLIYVPFKTSDVELEKKWLPLIDRTEDAEVLVWGNNLPSPIRKATKRITYVEDGFIRSVGLGANHTPPMSLCFDSKGPYFNSKIETDLENILNTYDFSNDQDLISRAIKLKDKIIDCGISKYNHNNDKVFRCDVSDKPRILVVGQVEDDASIIYGCDKPISNNDLVNIAALENPGSEIFYKPHPDVITKKRQMLSDPKEVEDIATVIYEDVSIASLLNESISRVYTITSQVGLEALIRDIPVTVLGCPFYSGWGITDDRQKNIRRKRKLTVDQVFAAAYILYPQYFDPYGKSHVAVEQVIDMITARLEIEKMRSDDPAKIIKSPSREGLRVARLSKSIDAGKRKAFLFGFGLQKITFFVNEFEGEYNVYTFDLPVNRQVSLTASQVISASGVKGKDVFIIWGQKDPEGLESNLIALGVEVKRVEDAFIRSIGLGGLQPIPLSYICDDKGIYFNSTKESRLEAILNNYDFADNPELLERSRSIIAKMVEEGTSKYNLNNDVRIEDVYGPKSGKRVLVIGQVEDDASIVYGCDKPITNNQLVYLARFENPGAQIIYKPHPDVLSGLRQRVSDPSVVEDIALVLYESISISSALETIDHVYTITSLSGFEALLRGIQVTTVGAPFYSGWGLTDDRQYIDRRQRRLSVEEVFAAAYIIYPIYVNPFTRQQCSPEDALKILDWMKKSNIHPAPSPSIIGNSQSHIRKIDALVVSGQFSEALTLANFAVSAYGDFDSYLARAKSRVFGGDVSGKTEADYRYACEITGWKNKKCLLMFARFLWEFRGYNKDLHYVLSRIRDMGGLSVSEKLSIAAMYADGGYFDSMLSVVSKGKDLPTMAGYLYLSYVLNTRASKFESSGEAEEVEEIKHPSSATARIYKGVVDSTAEFANYILSNKDGFCVVGNSPCELGSGNGARIDDFDCVVRFNDFNVDHPYSDDYGRKTSIWVRMPKNVGLSKKNVDNVIVSGSNWVSRMPDGIETFNLLQATHKSVAVIPDEIYKRLCLKLGAAPSAGLQMLFWIYTLVGKIREDQVFGFSLTDQAPGKNSHYASNDYVSVRHNWKNERVLFDEFIN